MFIMVYFHYRAVCLEQLLFKYFKTSPNEYSIPADIEKYVEHDDHHLLKVLKQSNNPYADSIVKNRIPEKIYESFNPDQLENLNKIEEFLKNEKIEYIRCSSSGRLSKYYNEGMQKSHFPIKVVRKQFGSSDTSFTNIDEATDLYNKYSQSHAISRLHCNLNSLPVSYQQKVQEFIAQLS